MMNREGDAEVVEHVVDVFETRVGENDPPGPPMTRVRLRSDGALVIDTGEEASSGVIGPGEVRNLMQALSDTFMRLAVYRSTPPPPSQVQTAKHWVTVCGEDIRDFVREFERLSGYGLPMDVIGAFRRVREVLLREGVYPESAYVRAQMRPPNFDQLPTEEQWSVDRRLGILDWDGSDDRQLSRVDEQPEPVSPDARVSPIFQGMHTERYDMDVNELDAAMLWEVENTGPASLQRKDGARVSSFAPSRSLLGRLLSSDPDRGVNPSPRDWMVASTVVQWLGSVRGQMFVHQLQHAAGLRIEEKQP